LPLNICPRCGWLDWGACSPSGICGDGVTDKGEECDDGNDDNNDGCIIVRKYNSQTKRMELDPANSCKKALCGDGYVWSGNETCDTGAKNINPSDKKSIQNVSNNCPYGKICNFCTTACKPSSVSGGYCGDLHVTPSYEICEPGLGKGNYGGDQALMSKYPGVEQICYPNCQAWCPTTFQKIPNLKLTSSPWTPNYVDQVDNFLSGDEWFIALPPCRYLEGISMDVNFQKVKLPDTMVMIVMDTSKGMDDIYSAAQIKKIDLAKQFVSDLIKAFDDQFVSFPNSLHIGVLTTPPLSGKKLRFYEDADFKACEAANNCCTEKWANETDEKYSVEDGAFKAKMDDNGFCWMQITKSNIDRTRCVYQCRVESTIRSPYGLNDPNKWFVRPNAPGEMNNLQSMVSGKIKTVDNQDYFDLWEAVDMAAGILDTAQSTKRIIVVVSGDETKEIFCGGQQSGPPFPRSYPTYVLHLQNNFGLGSCLSEYPLLGQTWYGYGYTEAQSLVQSIFAGTSVLNLTFNGKKTQIPLTGDINLDTAGIQCGNKENRLPIKLDWGGGGSAQIKNVTPSYCPLFP
jgi:cysteine-rich repeat protein